MKINTHILTFSLLLLVFSTSNVLACENSTVKASIEEMTCTSQDINCEESCCDKEKKHDNDCGGACCNFSCHCPNTVNIPIFEKNFELLSTDNFNTLDVTWTYVQHVPKEIYFSIWLPPKIS